MQARILAESSKIDASNSVSQLIERSGWYYSEWLNSNDTIEPVKLSTAVDTQNNLPSFTKRLTR